MFSVKKGNALYNGIIVKIKEAKGKRCVVYRRRTKPMKMQLILTCLCLLWQPIYADDLTIYSTQLNSTQPLFIKALSKPLKWTKGLSTVNK